MPGKDLDDGGLAGVVVAEPYPVPRGRYYAVAWIGQMELILGRCNEHPIPVQAHYTAGDGGFLSIRCRVLKEKSFGFICEAVLHWPA
jgi:hypothetical protein